MMIKKLAVLLSISLLLCGFSWTTLKLTEKDSGRTIKAKAGTCISICLEGNPTTGFTWESIYKVSPVLKRMKEPEFRSNSKLIGSGGKFTFQYKAARHGRTTLMLVYRRSWEKNIPPAKTFKLDIAVID
jgi:inhibitor of cysteine peptidase